MSDDTSVDTAELLEVLEQHPLLGRLDQAQRLLVAQRARERELGPGEAITREGAPANCFFLLLQGSARVTRTRPNGAQEMLGVLKVGSLFGVVGLSGRKPRPATIAALEPGRCAVFPVELINPEDDEQAPTSVALREVICLALNDQLRAANHRLFALANTIGASTPTDEWESKTEGGWKDPSQAD